MSSIWLIHLDMLTLVARYVLLIPTRTVKKRGSHDGLVLGGSSFEIV